MEKSHIYHLFIFFSCHIYINELCKKASLYQHYFIYINKNMGQVIVTKQDIF